MRSFRIGRFTVSVPRYWWQSPLLVGNGKSAMWLRLGPLEFAWWYRVELRKGPI